MATAGEWKSALECFDAALPLAQKVTAARPHGPHVLGRQLELEGLIGESLTYNGLAEEARALLQRVAKRSAELLQ